MSRAILKQLYLENNRQKYPSLPEAARSFPRWTDRSANGLTRMIMDFLRLKGHQAERISNTGRPIDNTKWSNGRIIGSIEWIRGTGTRGTADISATINGRSVKIEVKIGRDRQSIYQKRYQEQVEAAGGLYVIAKSFNQFYELYNELSAGTHCNSTKRK